MKLGIDYGTTTTLVSFSKSDISRSTLIDIGGNRTGYMRSSIPSSIAIDKNGQTFIGYKAEKLYEEKPNDIVLLRSLKRCLSCERKYKEKIDNCWNPINLSHCHGDQKLKIFNEYKNVSDLVHSFIIEVLELPKVKEIFEAKNMNTMGYSVPAIFGSEARYKTYDLLLQIFKDKVDIDIINEPTAAIIACQEKMLEDEDGIYAILDVGGGTTDIVIFEKKDRSYFLFKPFGLPIAGDDVDDAIMKSLFKKGFKSQAEKNRVISEVRRAKELLMVSKEVTIAGEKLLRTNFEKIIRPVLSKIVVGLKNEIKKVFDTYKPYSETRQTFKLEKIYLSGGGSKTPSLKEMIKNDPMINTLEPEISFVQNDELYRIYKEDIPIVAVAYGASMPKNRISDSIQYMLPYAIQADVGGVQEVKLQIYQELPSEFRVHNPNYKSIQILAIDPNNPNEAIFDLTNELFSSTDDEIDLSKFLSRGTNFNFKINEYNIMTVIATLPKNPRRPFPLPWQGGIESATFKKYRKEWRRRHGYI
jgi:hypothetical protein